MKDYGQDQIGLTFNSLRIANVERGRISFPESLDWSEADWMLALTGELGELANCLKKIKRGLTPSAVARGKKIPTKQDVAKELGDVQSYLDKLAHHLGIDLGQATRDKFNEISDEIGSGVKL